MDKSERNWSRYQGIHAQEQESNGDYQPQPIRHHIPQRLSDKVENGSICPLKWSQKKICEIES